MKRRVGEIGPNLFLNVSSQGRALVEHGQSNHGHGERRIVNPRNAVDRPCEQCQPLQGVVLGLHGNKNLPRRDKGIDCHQPQARRAVDEHIVQAGQATGLPAPQVLLQCVVQTRLAFRSADELDLDRRHVNRRRDAQQGL